MYLPPESPLDEISTPTQSTSQTSTDASNSLEETLESEKEIVLNYLGKTNKIQTNNVHGSGH
jgi:hypothetical protein